MQELSSVFTLLGMLIFDVRTGVLIALLVLAAVIDVRSFRIPNWLTASGVVFGLLYNGLSPASPQQGLLWAIEGMGIGLLLTLPLYALKTTGAGDVKLMAMVGAFLGAPAILSAVVFTFIVGGVTALGFAVFHKVLGRMVANVVAVTQDLALSVTNGVRPAPFATVLSVGKLPYGVNIAIGSVAYLVGRQFGFW
jgi:prepilin peptidase CpaA